MRKVGLVIDELFVKHINSFDHPESPDRVYVINDMLNETGLINHLTFLEPRDAKKEDITRVHTEKYFQIIEKTKGKVILASTTLELIKIPELKIDVNKQT